MKFVNEAKPRERGNYDHEAMYGFDRAPRLLFLWSGLFQRVISQAGTYLFGHRFHTSECAIYKCEGGCRIDGVGELVLTKNSCYFDHREKDRKREAVMASLITDVVFAWNPVDPIESMLSGAADHLKKKVKDCPEDIREQLKAAVSNSSCGGVFGGNALSYFFDWNPFSDPIEDRDYRRFCLVSFNGYTNEDVDQLYADEDLGKSLKDRLNKHIKKVNPDNFLGAMCCSPKRDKNGLLLFWVNTGRWTQIDGWVTQQHLENWMSKNEPLINQP